MNKIFYFKTDEDYIGKELVLMKQDNNKHSFEVYDFKTKEWKDDDYWFGKIYFSSFYDFKKIDEKEALEIIRKGGK